MIKKLLLVVAVLSLTLTACGSKPASSDGASKPDGMYKAETDDATVELDYGFRDTLEVEYKGGKVVAVTFESYDKDGNKKSELDPATYPMDPPPAEWIPMLQDNILKAGVSSAVDTVSGASNSSSNAIALFKAIETEGVAGETLSVNNTNR